MTELIVALDDPQRMLDHVSRLHSEAGVRWFKLDVRSMMHPERFHHVIQAINARGLGLFLDLKLYATKDTVRLAMFEAVALGAKMLTVHADCVEPLAADDRIKILSVRHLTDGTAAGDGYDNLPRVDGIICSVARARASRPHTRKLLVCPGIRPAGWPSDNHTVPATPTDAVAAGADYIVVGRPIIAAADPVEAAKNILRELAEASK